MERLFHVIVVGLLLTCSVHSRTPIKSEKSCKIHISQKVLQWPLILNKNFELYAAKTIELDGDDRIGLQTSVNIPDGEETYFSCAPNFFKKLSSSKHFTKVKCQAATNQFIAEDSQEAKNSSYFACDLRVIEEIVGEVEGCAKAELTSTKFGYVAVGESESSKSAVLVGEACYDEQLGKTNFGHVKLGGAGLSALGRTSSTIFHRPKYPDPYYKTRFFQALNIDELYARMRDRLKVKEAPFLEVQNYIGDFLLPHPQYQAIKKLSWNYFIVLEELQVLRALRGDIETAAKTHEIDVYVGGHGAKVLHGNGGAQMEVHLKEDGEKRRFPMPALIWFLVKKDQQATGFIVFNDKDFNEHEIAAQQAFKCSVDCTNIPWLVQTVGAKVERRGLKCCSYVELKAAIEEVPDLENIKGLFV